MGLGLGLKFNPNQPTNQLQRGMNELRKRGSYSGQYTGFSIYSSRNQVNIGYVYSIVGNEYTGLILRKSYGLLILLSLHFLVDFHESAFLAVSRNDPIKAPPTLFWKDNNFRKVFQKFTLNHFSIALWALLNFTHDSFPSKY